MKELLVILFIFVLTISVNAQTNSKLCTMLADNITSDLNTFIVSRDTTSVSINRKAHMSSEVTKSYISILTKRYTDLQVIKDWRNDTLVCKTPTRKVEFYIKPEVLKIKINYIN